MRELRCRFGLNKFTDVLLGPDIDKSVLLMIQQNCLYFCNMAYKTDTALKMNFPKGKKKTKKRISRERSK